MNEEIDTFNKFLVAAKADGLVFLKPIPQEISREDALLLAAYLVSMVGDLGEWDRYLTAVMNS